jgi:hypothetical protein
VIHGAALGLSALMASYNAAAWLRRRQSHLAINAVIYFSAVVWEQRHVTHHVAALCVVDATTSAAPALGPPETGGGRQAA